MRRRRPPAWTSVPVPPAQGNPGDGVLELKEKNKVTYNNADTTVLVRLGDGFPQIRCQLQYKDKEQDLAVFSEKDWKALKPPSGNEVTSFEFRRQTKGDFARLVLSNKFLIIIAPVIVAFCAIAPGVIWVAPSTIGSSAHIDNAYQLAGELSSTPGLSPRLRSEVTSLKAELSQAQASDASVMQQQSNNGGALLGYAIIVALLAVSAVVPQAIDWFRGPGWKSNDP